MTQKLPEILTMLQTALTTHQRVNVQTMEKQKLCGTVTAIEPATVKPYAERATIHLETEKGLKRMAAYTISHIEWPTN